MIEHELPLSDDMNESFPGMKFDFPYIWFWGEMEAYIGGHVPWHWHEEPELCHVVKGEVEYMLPEETITLSTGDAMFVNSNILHMIRPCKGCSDAVIVPQIFNKLLLTGYHRSVFDLKYYRPIINSTAVPYYVMRHDDENGASMVQLIDSCYQCAREENFGYEVYVRNYLSAFWIRLYQAVEPFLNSAESSQDKRGDRLKHMLKYIADHFAEDITLKEIADSANISERECIRCFRKQMQLSPFQYLMQRRIDVAANMLLHTDLPITEIALESGFQTSSYFSKCFKKSMNCTPRNYRNTTRQNQRPSCRSASSNVSPLSALSVGSPT